MTNKTRNYKITHNTNSKYPTTSLRPGLKQVHIGNDIWLIGKHKYTGNNLHCVIYGPERKEYHVHDNDVSNLWHDENDYCRPTFRHGNIFIESKVKIYILTHILDNKENWMFDLTKIPNTGKLKVIYENGTVRNIEFNGIFDNFSYYTSYKSKRQYKAVGYRLN